ncbi:MAG: YiiX/YebB-like N1pC/P60 family cysteine hydrolase [Bacteroidota bacterium]
MGIKVKKEELMLGDILLYHGNAFVSRAIRFFDGTYYNHASVYIGNDKVVESVAQGVVVANISQSIQGQQILVKRLNNRPYNMQPVVEIAIGYVGNRYGYEQLLLLVLIATTRRVRANNYLLRFVNKLLEKASVMILKMTNGDKQALICSELAYRSFDEVLPEHDDPYTIYLLRNLLSNTKSFKSNLIDNESLISKFYGITGSFDNKLSSSPFVEKSNSLYVESLKNNLLDDTTDEYFENELERLFDDVVKSYKKEDYNISVQEGDLFKKNMDIFMTSYNHLINKNKSFTQPKSMNSIINDFIHDNANFVTPGDLFKAKNLLNIGNLS